MKTTLVRLSYYFEMRRTVLTIAFMSFLGIGLGYILGGQYHSYVTDIQIPFNHSREEGLTDAGTIESRLNRTLANFEVVKVFSLELKKLQDNEDTKAAWADLLVSSGLQEHLSYSSDEIILHFSDYLSRMDLSPKNSMALRQPFFELETQDDHLRLTLRLGSQGMSQVVVNQVVQAYNHMVTEQRRVDALEVNEELVKVRKRFNSAVANISMTSQTLSSEISSRSRARKGLVEISRKLGNIGIRLSNTPTNNRFEMDRNTDFVAFIKLGFFQSFSILQGLREAVVQGDLANDVANENLASIAAVEKLYQRALIEEEPALQTAGSAIQILRKNLNTLRAKQNPRSYGLPYLAAFSQKLALTAKLGRLDRERPPTLVTCVLGLIFGFFAGLLLESRRIFLGGVDFPQKRNEKNSQAGHPATGTLS